MKRFSWLIVVSIIVVSCQDQDITPFEGFDPSLVPNNYTITTKKNATSARADAEHCGEMSSFTLWAGQHIDAGTVSVYNDETTLYVSYHASGDWTLSETHLYLGTTPPATRKGNLVIGKFPYKGEHDDMASVTYEIDMNGLDDCFDLYAHAVVNKDDNGEMVSQTAFGGDMEGDARRWYYYGSYCIQDCEEECVPEDASGWSSGADYTDPGNGMTYTVYYDLDQGVGVAREEQLTTEDGVEVGSVMFSDPWYNPITSVGEVTISILLYECWNFKEVASNVKIQGYDSAPDGSPTSSDFTYQYEAESGFIEVVVLEQAFYGVQVDLNGGCCD